MCQSLDTCSKNQKVKKENVEDFYQTVLSIFLLDLSFGFLIHAVRDYESSASFMAGCGDEIWLGVKMKCLAEPLVYRQYVTWIKPGSVL